MSRIRQTLAALLLGSLYLTSTSQAQEAPSKVADVAKAGDVIEILGPVGSVIVARGSQSYALQDGDALFDGDRIFTRSNGGVRLNANGCERKLDASASITISKDICKVAPTLISSEAALGLNITSIGQTIATTSEVGASPNLLGALAGGGAAAAAATSGSGVAIID